MQSMTDAAFDDAVMNDTFSGMKCSTCSRRFKKKFNLVCHMRTHTKEKLFTCDVCQKSFASKFNLNRHKANHVSQPDDATTPAESLTVFFKCNECDKTFIEKDNYHQHMEFHENSRVSCDICNKQFRGKFELSQHLKVLHSCKPLVSVKCKKPMPTVKSKKMKFEQSNNMFSTEMIFPEQSEEHDLDIFQANLRPRLKESIFNALQEKEGIKWYTIMRVSLIRKTSDDEIEEIRPYLSHFPIMELVDATIDDHISESFAKIKKSLDEFIQSGSGWVLNRILQLELKIAKYHPLAASSYIPLPKKLAAKKAIVNIQNSDNKCFVWCLLAHKLNIHWKNHPERVSHYVLHEAEIQLGNVQLPVSVCKISTIEKLNNLRINVYGYEEDEIVPLYISSKDNVDCINLLLISNGEQLHYCLIKNMSRLLGDLTKKKSKRFYCHRCLHRFCREDLLKIHIEYCKHHAPQHIKLPADNENILKFQNIHYQHPVAYIIYADFESLIVPISSSSPNPQSSFTEKIAKHIPCGYAYVIVGPDGKSVKPPQVYRGENTVEHFLNRMMYEKEELSKKLTHIKSMQLTDEQEVQFQQSENCNLCGKPLNTDRVRDHDHLTGQYRGALHFKCNLKYRQSKMIPVVFHNLKNYDGHLIMQELGKYKDHEISVIPSTMENYISFKIRKPQCLVQMVFIDSFQFLPTSLEKLTRNLNINQFNILTENFPSDIPLHLLIRKGVYPYEYLTSLNKFNETELPPPEAFFNTLNEEPISDEDYQHALNVWSACNIQNLGEYHDLYVKTDVLLLADVFQNFRQLCLKYYEIDPAHLFTSPGLAWQASLKMTQQPLELFTDINMLLFIEKGIRGGISQISHRYVKANNPFLPDFDKNLEESYIMYLDANNLYGWAMSQPLPYGQFAWASTENITPQAILTLPDDADIGYIFEVDLEYPDDLHDLHNDYPLAAERMTVSSEMLSPYARSVLSEQKYSGTPKLIPNLYNKSHYVVHYRTLKLYLQLGLILTKIHKALKFKQSPWLKTYIDFNTDKRKNATSSFEKDFFKLLNNSVYGKTMENLRKRRSIELCHNEKRAKKLVACSTFKAFKTFNKDLTAVERIKASIVMNRPIYVGFTILELSKFLMYDFHYNFIKKQYNKHATLLFTDTDSLTYHIKTPNIYTDLEKHTEMFDFSDYPAKHRLQSDNNKKVIGKFKDELNGEIAIEFVGLKAKMYSILSSTSEKKRAKGVSTRIVREKITHSDYLKCLQEQKTSAEKQTRIAQDNHELFTLQQKKISLSPFDDKRYLLDDGISSYAYGHKKIKHL